MPESAQRANSTELSRANHFGTAQRRPAILEWTTVRSASEPKPCRLRRTQFGCSGGLAAGEPLPQLVGVQGVGAPGVAGQIGHRRQSAVVIVVGWNGKGVVGSEMESPHAATRQAAQPPLAANAARSLDLIDASPVPVVVKLARRQHDVDLTTEARP